MTTPQLTLADLLSDLRFAALYHSVRRSELDHGGAHLLDLGWAELRGRDRLTVTDDGLDVLDACRDVRLPS